MGFVGTVAQHFELGPIALGLVKRNVADDAAAAQTPTGPSPSTRQPPNQRNLLRTRRSIPPLVRTRRDPLVRTRRCGVGGWRRVSKRAVVRAPQRRRWRWLVVLLVIVGMLAPCWLCGSSSALSKHPTHSPPRVRASRRSVLPSPTVSPTRRASSCRSCKLTRPAPPTSPVIRFRHCISCPGRRQYAERRPHRFASGRRRRRRRAPTTHRRQRGSRSRTPFAPTADALNLASLRRRRTAARELDRHPRGSQQRA